jgi:protein-S-isoprenylcysteine O-methyltransferase Ste14
MKIGAKTIFMGWGCYDMVKKQEKKTTKAPLNYFFMGIIMIIVLFFILPKFNIIKFPYNLIGVFFMVLGIWIILWVWNTFKKNNTPESFEKSKFLVTQGLFKYSRNPMYIGKILFLTGLAVLFGNILGFISPLLFFIIMDKIIVPLEEKKTSRDLGKKYLNYKNRVRRWI